MISVKYLLYPIPQFERRSFLFLDYKRSIQFTISSNVFIGAIVFFIIIVFRVTASTTSSATIQTKTKLTITVFHRLSFHIYCLYIVLPFVIIISFTVCIHMCVILFARYFTSIFEWDALRQLQSAGFFIHLINQFIITAAARVSDRFRLMQGICFIG